MKLIIAGGRDFIPQQCHWDWLDELRKHHAAKNDPVDEVISGRARGADMFGYKWAEKNGIKNTEFQAQWVEYGKLAGPMRNAQMAAYLVRATYAGNNVAVILFPGGRGTQSMYNEAKKRELTIYDWRERTE